MTSWVDSFQLLLGMFHGFRGVAAYDRRRRPQLESGCIPRSVFPRFVLTRALDVWVAKQPLSAQLGGHSSMHDNFFHGLDELIIHALPFDRGCPW